MVAAPEQDWYLQDWADKLGKKQNDLVTELGMHKNTAHLVWHGKQPYRRELVNRLSRWLGIRPYELLMPPAEAIALRRMRESAALIMAEEGAAFEGMLEPPATAAKRR